MSSFHFHTPMRTSTKHRNDAGMPSGKFAAPLAGKVQPGQLTRLYSQLAGTASSAPMTNVGGTMSDIWAVHERGIPMAIFSATIL